MERFLYYDMHSFHKKDYGARIIKVIRIDKTLTNIV